MIQGLGNDLNDSLGTLTRRHETKPTRFRCLLRRVNIIRHMVDVTGRNYSGPSKVKCSASVARQMGTPDRPQVFAGDVCWIERQPDNKWLCVEIRNKTHCATSTDSDVEIDSTADIQNSYSAQGSFGITLTPLDLMPSPIEQLGQLTPFAERFPTPANELCGIPQCTICAPSGYVAGMAIILSSDIDHPEGCWVWGFRCGGCTGTPLFQSVLVYDTQTYSGAPYNNIAFYVHRSGKFVYALAQSAYIFPTFPTNYLYLIDTVDLTAMTILGNDGGFFIGTPPAVAKDFTVSPDTDSTTFSDAPFEVGVLSTPIVDLSASTGAYATFKMFPPPTLPADLVAGNPIQFYTPFWVEAFVRAGITYYISDIRPNAETFLHGAVRSGFQIVTHLILNSINYDYIYTDQNYTIWDYNETLQLWCGVTDAGDLEVWNFANLGSITLIGTLAGIVAVGECAKLSDDGYLYVGDDSTQNFVTIDVTVPTAPTLVASTDLGGKSPRGMDICTNFLFVSLADGTLQSYDLGLPSSPAYLGEDIASDFTPYQKFVQAKCGGVFVLGVQTSTGFPTLAAFTG